MARLGMMGGAAGKDEALDVGSAPTTGVVRASDLIVLGSGGDFPVPLAVRMSDGCAVDGTDGCRSCDAWLSGSRGAFAPFTPACTICFCLCKASRSTETPGVPGAAAGVPKVWC